MTRTTNARLAGFIFLIYIAITSMILSRQIMSGAEGVATKLASIAQNASLVRVSRPEINLRFSVNLFQDGSQTPTNYQCSVAFEF